ncbi:uncharacterized protein LOC124110540 [Haliotis rufescens]|uniref:uncharacterized protein LOC124110540 n=1 Tax=Haliotis rufescens TaxID=6454 RepID=UPI00201F2EDB|nr:uncharacterized protein LOC124110540 [Haliotis rufescens]
MAVHRQLTDNFLTCSICMDVFDDPCTLIPRSASYVVMKERHLQLLLGVLTVTSVFVRDARRLTDVFLPLVTMTYLTCPQRSKSTKDANHSVSNIQIKACSSTAKIVRNCNVNWKSNGHL